MGGDFINAQKAALTAQKELNILLNDEKDDAEQVREIDEARAKVAQTLVDLGEEGNASTVVALKLLKELNDLELTRKERQEQINHLKKAEKALVGSEKSGVVANTILDKTLQLRKDEAKATNLLLANKLELQTKKFNKTD